MKHNSLYQLISEIIFLYSSALMTFILMSSIFMIVGLNKKLICNLQNAWWKSICLKVDVQYAIFTPLFKIVLRYVPVLIIYCFLLVFLSPTQINLSLINEWGPLARVSWFWQTCVYLIISDFLHYWNHRLFHVKLLWPIHAVHHSAIEVNWTTAYRFHPLNLALGPWLTASIMVFMGASPLNIIYTAPLEAFMAYFVHANLNITLGPLNYILATPVFHRWHHTYYSDGGGTNFGSIFSFWDFIFGTFYLPDYSLPSRYGIEACNIDENYLKQLIYPFVTWKKVFSDFIGLT